MSRPRPMLRTMFWLWALPVACFLIFFALQIPHAMSEEYMGSFPFAIGLGFFVVFFIPAWAVLTLSWAAVFLLIYNRLAPDSSFRSRLGGFLLGACSQAPLITISNFILPDYALVAFVVGLPLGAIAGLLYVFFAGPQPSAALRQPSEKHS